MLVVILSNVLMESAVNELQLESVFSEQRAFKAVGFCFLDNGPLD